jgi:hypothetical protein
MLLSVLNDVQVYKMCYACGEWETVSNCAHFLYLWREADNYATNGTGTWNLLLNNFEQNCT